MKGIRKILSVVAVLAVMQMIYLGAPGQASAATCTKWYLGRCVSYSTSATVNPGGIDWDVFLIPDMGTNISVLDFFNQNTDVNQLSLNLTDADLALLGVNDINALTAALQTSSNFAGWSISGSTGTETAYMLTITRPDPPTSVPEPSTIFLIGAALFGLAGIGIMRRKKTAAK